jgi:ABC-type transporter Mla MlaB component
LTEPRTRAPAPPPSGARGLSVSGRVGTDDAARLCDDVQACAGDSPEGPLACDVGAVDRPDIGTVDALARMALAARRLGRRLELRAARRELRELLVLAGLEGLAVEVRREAEQREQALGVEEEHDPVDVVA